MSILIASVLLLSGERGASALEQTSSQQSRNQSNTNEACRENNHPQNDQAISPAFIAAVLGTLRSLVSEQATEHGQEHADHEDWNTPALWIPFGANAMLIIIGAFYTCAAFRLLRVTEIQSQIATLAAEAATKSAEAAMKSADTLINAESPYLDVTDIKFSLTSIKDDVSKIKLRVGVPPSVLITIKNIGRTPAFDVGVMVTFACFPGPSWGPKVAAGRTVLIIGSGDSRSVECICDLPLGQDEIAQIEDGSLHFHADWRFSFSDIAGRDISFGFDSYYLPHQTLNAVHFDFPGYPRWRETNKI